MTDACWIISTGLTSGWEIQRTRGKMPADFVFKQRYYTQPPEVHAKMDYLTMWDLDEDVAGRFADGVLCYSSVGWEDGDLPA